MFQYEDLIWSISFPIACGIMLWFSLALAVLVRAGGGRRRRSNARQAIKRLIRMAPLIEVDGVPVSQTRTSMGDEEEDAQEGESLTSVMGSSVVAEHDNEQDGEDDEDGEEEDRQRRKDKEKEAVVAAGNVQRAGEHSISGHSRQETKKSMKGRRVRGVVIPAALRIATRAVVRRAVVLVGGDFARSPRMQYHAASLARSGLFDEILLVGLDLGNQLSEDLLQSGEPTLEEIVTREGGRRGSAGAMEGMEEAIYDVEERLANPRQGHGCIVSTRYLVTPPVVPDWLQTLIPVRSLYWMASTLYRVGAMSLLFAWQAARAIAVRINAHGQFLVTDVVFVQSPPCVPFILLLKYLVLPMSFLYSSLLYYCVVVPAAWMNRDAMSDIRRHCHVQHARFPRGVLAPRKGGIRPRSSHEEAPSAPVRPWVFYATLIVDWHNYGFSILEQAQRPTLAVGCYKALELNCCAGDVNLTVSKAMKESLEEFYPFMRRRAFMIDSEESGEEHHGYTQGYSRRVVRGVVVLYDVAPSFFAPVPRSRCVRDVLAKSVPAPSSPTRRTVGALGASPGAEEWGLNPPPSWILQHDENGTSSRNGTRRLMMVGATSWTEDDDYSIVVEALQRLDFRLVHEDRYTEGGSGHGKDPATAVWVLITGKGPARQRFEDAVRAAALSRHVVVSTYYAQSYTAYSTLLGAADVGLCLHRSASGLDLPMKGVDMVGAGLPVMALNYPAIGELMQSSGGSHSGSGDVEMNVLTRDKHGEPSLMECERGWIFSSATDLELLWLSFLGISTATASAREVWGVSTASASASAGDRVTPLELVKARALRARQAALTWDENWNTVLLPILKQIA